MTNRDVEYKESVRQKSTYKLDVCIYVLDDSFRKDAEELKVTLKKSVSDRKVKTCPHNNKWTLKRQSISDTCQHFVQCEQKYDVKTEQQSTGSLGQYFTTGITISISTKCLSDLVDLTMMPSRKGIYRTKAAYHDSQSSQASPDQSFLHCHVDVVVIFGHCSMYNCGPFSTDELLAALTKVNPTIVAFLGCCGGSRQYGPIMKMMHVLNPMFIVGFYQRRVYVDELHETSLVDGLKNYLYLINNDLEFGMQAKLGFMESYMTNKLAYYKRAFAIHAFGYAQSCVSYEKSSLDPTYFANDNEPNLCQIIRYDHKHTVDPKDLISLACLQFAIYHRILVDSSKMKPIEVSLEFIIKRLPKKYSGDQINQEFVEELRAHKLHIIVALICELGLLNLHKDSLVLIKKGDQLSWKNIDHLQFLLAMLRGHWGKNPLTVIRKWATYHLREMIADTSNDDSGCLHKYKLCCVCYALLCEHHFVRFVNPGDENYYFGILACTRSDLNDDLYDVTPQSAAVDLPHIPSGPYHSKGELQNYNWVDLFSHCEYIEDCVKVCTTHCTWNICNLGDKRYFQYTISDFQLAIAALTGYLNKKYTKLSKCYKTQLFSNTSNPDMGYMKCFDIDDVSFHEMRVIAEPKKVDQNAGVEGEFSPTSRNAVLTRIQNHRINWDRVSFCRFIFAKFNNPAGNTKKKVWGYNERQNRQSISATQQTEGLLFYTDSHYGHLLINFDHHEKLLNLQDTSNCWYIQRRDTGCYTRYMQHRHHLSHNRLVDLLCYPCKYEMQNVTIEGMLNGKYEKTFPFKCIGKLTLKDGTINLHPFT